MIGNGDQVEVVETNAEPVPSAAAARIVRLRRLEWICFGLGSVLVLFFCTSRVQSAVSQQRQLEAFQVARAGLEKGPIAEFPVDQALWSEERIEKYAESLNAGFDPPLGVLRISRIGLEVAVLLGTDELTLNRAVGNIPGTALPGEAGNVAIAGHRDGFFRGLKDLATGDRLELETLAGTLEYRVTSLTVVDPKDVHVLAPTERPSITLVTCYPFYYFGKAPQRFIVRAEAPAVVGEMEARQDR